MVMKEFAQCKDHCNSDSTFLVFMSHGVRAGLCGTKSRGETTDILSLDTIYETFNNKSCRALLGKPKVVIIQSCRGSESLLGGACEASEPARLSQGTGALGTGWGWDTPSSLMAGPAFLGNKGSVFVSDSANRSLCPLSSADETAAGLEDDAIFEVHLESDFATLHSSTPGKQFLETVAPPEGGKDNRVT